MNFRPPRCIPVIAAVAATSLAGCGGDVALRASEVETNLPVKTAAIVPGQTDRAAARHLLGEPWLSSDRWAFDLFRLSDKDVRALYFAVPLPVPVGVMTDEVRGYVLVQYDAGGVVAALDKGVTHGENLSWRQPLSGADNVLLRAGDVGLAVDMDKGTPSVFVSTARRDAYIAAQRGLPVCTVLIGCKQSTCSSTLIVDGGPPLSLPGRWFSVTQGPDGRVTTREQRWLAPLALTPGTHRFEIPENRFSTFKASTEFSCRAGDALFAAIEIRPVEEPPGERGRIHWKPLMQGSIEVQQEVPAAFREQPLLVYRGGSGWVAP